MKLRDFLASALIATFVYLSIYYLKSNALPLTFFFAFMFGKIYHDLDKML